MSQEVTNNKSNSNAREGLALVIGGLFVLGIVFATYTYFNKSVNVEQPSEETTQSQSALERLKSIISSNTAREENSGTNEGEEKKEEQPAKTDGVEKAVETIKSENVTSQPTVRAGAWVANDYKYGDIKGNSYTVKSGDTLWEIAEGLYGNGTEWTKILRANSGSIGFLPNGQQALIVPGQVLVLP